MRYGAAQGLLKLGSASHPSAKSLRNFLREVMLSTYVEDTEKSDEPCWVGFYDGMDRENDKIPITYKEAEAAKWILMGWDVGFLEGGLNKAESVKWLT